jgi:tRNA-binding EMAP/Myf-like protein
MSDQGEDDDQFNPDEMMMDDGPDLGDLLGSMLMDDEGKNVVNVLSEIKSQIEMQNRLLIKLVGAVIDLKPKPTA